MGQFFAAMINAEKALEFDPTNAHTYGQLGIIFGVPQLRGAMGFCMRGARLHSQRERDG